MIKRIFISLVVLLVSSTTLLAQNDGVKFFNGSFDEALAQAKKDHMLLIIDCYTSWCGPCKSMSENVFPTKTCGDFFNGKFVFMKIDMEKGEGIELSKRFSVRSFPTFLILNGEGEEQHRLIGGGTVESFIERVKLAADPKTSMLGLKLRYADGERNSEFIKRYVEVLFETKNKEEGKRIYDSYYNSLSDDSRQSTDNWWLFNFQDFSDFGSAKFDYLLKNKKLFFQSIGAVKYNERVESILIQEYKHHITGSIRNITEDKKVISQRADQLLLCEVKSEQIKLFNKFYRLIKSENLEDYKKGVESFIKNLNDEKAVEFYDLFTSNYQSKIDRLKFSSSLGVQLISRLKDEKLIKQVEHRISISNRIITAIENSTKK